MPKRFRCPQGHEWEVTSGDPFTAAVGAVACPQCGEAAATLPPFSELTGRNGSGAAAAGDQVTRKAAPVGPQIPGYELLGELGRGGMGVVYKARQLRLKRLVALKMIRAGGQADLEDLARFRLEAEAAARLQHANIVQIHEVGEHDGQPFFSLELVDGGSLERRLAGGPLPPRDAAALVATLARAMHYAHEQGVVHRDLKPANVLLARDGTPKITDFGLAKQLDADSGQTRSGVILGTPNYMAPEQAEGRTKEIGPPADVYALGAVLYECLTGRPPFRGASVLETLLQVRTQEPVPPRRHRAQVPRDLETVCLKCLEKDPRKRYPSALSLADDLRRFQGGEPIRARPAGAGERAAKWVRRRPAAAALLAVAVVAVAAVAGVAWRWRQTERERLQIEQDAAGRFTVAIPTAEFGGHPWRYTTTDPGEGWQADGFDDRAWNTGRGAFASPGKTGLTVRTGWTSPDVWLRTTVPLPPLADATVVFHYFHDDDVEVYVNGHEVLRGAGAVTGYRQQVLGPHERSFFRDGDNVIAVHCHNAAGGQGVDVGLEWRAGGGDAEPPPTGPPPAGPPLVAGKPEAPHELYRLVGQGGPVYSVALSADGRRALLGCDDGTVRLWDLAAGREVYRCEGHTDAVYAVAITPDGRRGLSGGRDRTVRLWDLDSGRQALRLGKHNDSVLSVAFSQDGQTGVSGSKDHVLRLWDLAAGAERQALPSDCGYGVAFTPDGRHVLTGSCQGRVQLYDVRTGQVQVLGQGGAETWATLSADARRALSGHSGGSVRLWDVAGGRLAWESAARHTAAVTAVALAPGGRFAASADADGAVWLWDVATGVDLYTFKGHKGPVRGLAFFADGRRFLSAGADGTVRGWELPDEQTFAARFREREVLPGRNGLHADYFAGPNFERLVKTRLDPQAHFDWGGGSPDPAVPNDLFSARWTGWLKPPRPGRYRLITLSDDGVRLWLDGELLIDAWGGLNSERREVPVELDDRPHALRLEYLELYGGAHVSLRWAQEGAFGEQPIPAWALRHDDGGPLRCLEGHGDAVKAVAYSPDGKYLLSGGGGTFDAKGGHDGTDFDLRLWDAATGQEVRRLTGHTRPVNSVAFSPDGRLALSGGMDRTVRLWNVATGRELRRFTGHGSPVLGVAFSPDGKRALSCAGRFDHRDGKYFGVTDERALRLWDVATGKELPLTVRPPDACGVSCAAFSPDGRQILAGLTDGRLYLWDVATGKERLSVRAHKKFVTAVAFSPDGKRALSGGNDDEGPKPEADVRVWDLGTGREVSRFRGHRDHPYVFTVAFSPDGRHALSGGWDKALRYWEVATGRQVAALEGHGWQVNAVAFSPDGRQAVSGSDDKTVRLWRLPDEDRGSALATARPFVLERYGTARAALATEGNVQRVDVTAVDSTPWHVKFGRVFEDLREGATYAVRFRARADAPCQVFLYGMIVGPDWHGIGLNQPVPLTRDWQTYEYRFQAKGVAAQNVIEFQAGDRTGTVWVAGLTLTGDGPRKEGPPDGFEPLFNGKDLSGWKVCGGRAADWGVGDGVLFTEGTAAGWLMTEKEYADFELRLEYRLTGRANSGVALRSPLEGDATFSGLEVQVADDAAYPGFRPAQQTGSLYDVVPPTALPARPAGAWNQMRVTARGRRVTVEVNGTKVLDADLDRFKGQAGKHPGLLRAGGHLGLQSHTGRVEFRQLYVKPLGGTGAREEGPQAR